MMRLREEKLTNLRLGTIPVAARAARLTTQTERRWRRCLRMAEARERPRLEVSRRRLCTKKLNRFGVHICFLMNAYTM